MVSMEIKLTQEQQDIVNCEFIDGGTLKIIAFAGTGKTTTLIEYSKKRPQKKFLYIAFNKSVQTEASSKFPRNVECRTAHSLAWRKFGIQYNNKLIANLKPYFINKDLNLNNYEDSNYVGKTLYNYLISEDTEPSKKHIPEAAYKAYKYYNKKLPDFVELSKDLWQRMLDPENPTIGMLHDGYLKLYQLSNPSLNYDFILLDEAQDINPVIANIVFSQKVSKIVVGDPYQQIYSFRGAQNILSKIDCNILKYLTNSFRFTRNIANIANCILETFQGETKELVGLKQKGNIIENSGYTYIARTNASIFDKAAKEYKKNSIGFIGGIQGYRFDDIENAYYLFASKKDKISNSFINIFESYFEMKSYANSVTDRELIGICKVVEEYGNLIPELISNIRKCSVPANMAKVQLSTAHKAKGLEWDVVHLSNDFINLIDDNNNLIDVSKVDIDEFNLIYVAVTRSKMSLKVKKDSSLRSFIKFKLSHKKEHSKAIDKNTEVVDVLIEQSVVNLKNTATINFENAPKNAICDDLPQIELALEENSNENYFQLNETTKSYIKSRVYTLGSHSAVEAFYNNDSLVSKYAIYIAAKLFKNVSQPEPLKNSITPTQITECQVRVRPIHLPQASENKTTRWVIGDPIPEWQKKWWETHKKRSRHTNGSFKNKKTK